MSVSYVLVIAALIFQTIAFNKGKAGIVTTIDNLKSLWQTTVVMVLTSQIPNGFQICGMVFAIAGAIIIVTGK